MINNIYWRFIYSLILKLVKLIEIYINLIKIIIINSDHNLSISEHRGAINTAINLTNPTCRHHLSRPKEHYDSVFS